MSDLNRVLAQIYRKDIVLSCLFPITVYVFNEDEVYDVAIRTALNDAGRLRSILAKVEAV